MGALMQCKLKIIEGKIDQHGQKCYKCSKCGKKTWSNYPAQMVHVMCSSSPSKGLGDTIAKITKKLGIKPCSGCKDRQKKLNQMFPYPSPNHVSH